MKRTSGKSQGSTAAVLSAGVLIASGAAAQAPKVLPSGQKAPAASQGFPQPSPAGQQERVDRGSAHIKFAAKFHKDSGLLSTAGLLNGQPVFKNAQGEFFQVDPNTGDLKFHTAESLGFMKYDPKGKAASSGPLNFIKFGGIKGEQRVTLVGVDLMGHVLQKTSQGQMFYLSPTGDMVFVK